MDDAVASKFNINIIRDVFLIGDAAALEAPRRMIRGFHFLSPRDGTPPEAPPGEIHFVVAVVDLTEPAQVARAARELDAFRSTLAHRIIVATSPDIPGKQHLLLAQELGVRLVASGPGREAQLKDYLKRICLEAHQTGTIAPLAQELAAAEAAGDLAAAERVLDKLKTWNNDGEELTRLRALAALAARQLKRAEGYLKRLLAINPQNLWAANTLGKLYLRAGDGARGIEVLARMSSFHELSAERLLTLGNAQVQAGLVADAERAFRAGRAAAVEPDARFDEGLAKVRFARGDFPAALQLLGRTTFSTDVLSFLNLRAILASRGGDHAASLAYYDQALAGAGDDKVLRAKLQFNKALALVKKGDLEAAAVAFTESVALGGPRYARANGPLAIVQAVMKSGNHERTAEARAQILAGGDWETLY
jgi:tetratricopeptide (TPR) repeat protein